MTPAERPILFSGPMVRAILAGAKTQTRRVVLPQPAPAWEAIGTWDRTAPWWTPGLRLLNNDGEEEWNFGDSFRCPYGSVGDRLWVRERWALEPDPVRVVYPAATLPFEIPAGGDRLIHDAPSSDVDRWLERRGYVYVDGLGHRCIERARSAGWNPSIYMPRWACRLVLEVTDVRVERLQDITAADAVAEGADIGLESPQSGFRRLWNSINGKRPGCSWEENPWVWAISFRRVVA